MAILGIDEVGRGPLAGPLVVGAVILPELKPAWMERLKDSKKLTAWQRNDLNEKILHGARATGLGWVSAAEIDEMGMSKALKLATRRAVETVQAQKVPFSQIIIDGKVNFLAGTALGKYVSTLIKADDLIKEVSAASIIAKVARDNYMIELAEKYPGYGFERHVGYGTAAHMAALQELGLCPEHRRSFAPCKKMHVKEARKKTDEKLVERGMSDELKAELAAEKAAGKMPKKNTTEVGKRAERKVARYLEDHGHMIIEQNYRTKYCEIDLVSIDLTTMKIFFTEVKYRKDDEHGGGLAAVDQKKQERMKFAAEVFLKKNPKYREYDPLLTAAEVAGERFEVREWVPVG